MTRQERRRPWFALLVAVVAAVWVARRHQRRQRLWRSNRQARVLVVGDESPLLAHYGGTLTRAGYQVSTLDARLDPADIQPASDWDLVLVCASDDWLAQALRQVGRLALSGPLLVLQDHALNLGALHQAMPDEPSILLGYPRVPALKELAVGPLDQLVVGESDGSRTIRMAQAEAVLRRAGSHVRRERRILAWIEEQAALRFALCVTVLDAADSSPRISAQASQHAFLDRYKRSMAALSASGVHFDPLLPYRVWPVLAARALVRLVGAQRLAGRLRQHIGPSHAWLEREREHLLVLAAQVDIHLDT